MYTVHRGNIDNPAFLSGWDLRPDPTDPQRLDPVQIPVLQEPGVSYEGIDTAGGLVFVALRQNGLGIYQMPGFSPAVEARLKPRTTATNFIRRVTAGHGALL